MASMMVLYVEIVKIRETWISMSPWLCKLNMNRLSDGVDDTVPVLTGGYFEARMKARESRDEARNEDIIIFFPFYLQIQAKNISKDRSFPCLFLSTV